MDSQWPRFEVFEQARPGEPHRNAGAVHAPDAEMALLNARDVFGRRPYCASLWVAPATAIYSRTAEELGVAGLGDQQAGNLQTYHLFNKTTQRQAETYVSHVGDVVAASGAAALKQALTQAGAAGAFVWWAVPESAVTRSLADEREPFFAPALDKPFRQPNAYHVLTQMRAVRSDEKGNGQA